MSAPKDKNWFFGFWGVTIVFALTFCVTMRSGSDHHVKAFFKVIDLLSIAFGALVLFPMLAASQREARLMGLRLQIVQANTMLEFVQRHLKRLLERLNRSLVKGPNSPSDFEEMSQERESMRNWIQQISKHADEIEADSLRPFSIVLLNSAPPTKFESNTSDVQHALKVVGLYQESCAVGEKIYEMDAVRTRVERNFTMFAPHILGIATGIAAARVMLGDG